MSTELAEDFKTPALVNDHLRTTVNGYKNITWPGQHEWVRRVTAMLLGSGCELVIGVTISRYLAPVNGYDIFLCEQETFVRFLRFTEVSTV